MSAYQQCKYAAIALTISMLACRADSPDPDRLTLTAAEAAALVDLGREFTLSSQEVERKADEFLREEAIRTGSAQRSAKSRGAATYQVEVQRSDADLIVRFVPSGEDAAFHRDGTVEYRLRPGERFQRIRPAE